MPSASTPIVTATNVKTFVPGSGCPPKAFSGVASGHMRVNQAVDDIAAHADQVGGRGGIFGEGVARGQGAIGDGVHLIIPHGPDGIEDHGSTRSKWPPRA